MAERRTVNDLLEAARARIDRLDPEAAHRAMSEGATIVDTRCDDLRRETGIVPGSVHVPLSVLFWRLDPGSGQEDPRVADLDRRLILICAHGYSSSLAAATLRDLGFSLATDVAGGFAAWAAAGLPVEPAAQVGRVSRIRATTTRPETPVSAATAPIANDIPKASARTPAITAPIAKPRSRQSR